MQHPTLLIVDNNDELFQFLQQSLSEDYTLHYFSDSQQALEHALKIPFDLIVLDLMLTGLDGLTLLQRLREQEIPAPAFVVGKFITDYVCEAAQDLGIQYLVRKPCDLTAVMQRICHLLERSREESIPKTPTAILCEQLDRLGFSNKYQGYTYLCHCAVLLWKSPALPLTKEVYPQVGAAFHVSGSVVEHSMRTALNYAWKHCGTTWDDYALASFGESHRPNLGYLLNKLAELLNRQIGRWNEESSQ